jgi:hypothetical protein
VNFHANTQRGMKSIALTTTAVTVGVHDLVEWTLVLAYECKVSVAVDVSPTITIDLYDAVFIASAVVRFASMPRIKEEIFLRLRRIGLVNPTSPVALWTRDGEN